MSYKRLVGFKVDDDEWETFKRVVHDADPNVSASHALRELIHWYNGGCGGKLRLTIPVLFPSRPPQ